MRNLAIAVLVIVAVAAGWVLRGEVDREGLVARATSAKSAHASLPPATVLAVHPGNSPSPSTEPSHSKLSPIRQEINGSGNLGAIYANLAAPGPRTPEEKWLMARLARMCGRVVNPDQQAQLQARKGSAYKAPTPEEMRSKLIDSIPVDDPYREKRIAAYDAREKNPCDTMKDVEMQPKDYRRLLEDAAAGGNVNARLDLTNDDIGQQYVAQLKAGKTGLPSITPAQVDTIKDAVASGDPYAITEGVKLLAASYSNMSLRDAQGQAVDMRAMIAAGNLLACDAGYSCGDQHPDLLMGCSMFGRCAANNLRDYTMYYSASPYASQLVAQYEQSLRNAMANNDWSGFRTHPGPASMPGAMLW